MLPDVNVLLYAHSYGPDHRRGTVLPPTGWRSRGTLSRGPLAGTRYRHADARYQERELRPGRFRRMVKPSCSK